MKKITMLLLLVLLPAALPALAGQGGKCTMDTQACLNHYLQMKGSGWSGLELDKSDLTAIKIKAITPGGPAVKAGFEVGDVVTAINGASLTDMEALKKAKGEWKRGQVVTYTIKRKNAEKQIAVTLADMPEAVYTSMVGAHMIDNHAVAATAATPETQAQPATTPATAPTQKTDK